MAMCNIQQTARMEREVEEFEIDVRKEIQTEMLRRKLMENREVSADDVEESARIRVRARYEVGLCTSRVQL
jgi:hypothetical protein